MNAKLIALLIAASVLAAGQLSARGGGGHGGGGHGGGGFHGGGHGGGFHGGGHGGGFHGGGHGGGFHGGGHGAGFHGGGHGGHGHGGHGGGYHGRGYGYRGWGYGLGVGLGLGYLGAWALFDPWPYADRGPWYQYTPEYWDLTPYFGPGYPQQIVISEGDFWNFINDTDGTILVGTYDGVVRGRLRPGQSVKIPRRGDDRFVVSAVDSKGQVYRSDDQEVSITNDMIQ